MSDLRWDEVIVWERCRTCVRAGWCEMMRGARYISIQGTAHSTTWRHGSPRDRDWRVVERERHAESPLSTSTPGYNCRELTLLSTLVCRRHHLHALVCHGGHCWLFSGFFGSLILMEYIEWQCVCLLTTDDVIFPTIETQQYVHTSTLYHDYKKASTTSNMSVVKRDCSFRTISGGP